MGELYNELMESPHIGSFYRRPDVREAANAVSDDAKKLLRDLVRSCDIPPQAYFGKLHPAIVTALEYAFRGQADRFFHDLMAHAKLAQQVREKLEQMESRSFQRTDAVDQLLRVARLKTRK